MARARSYLADPPSPVDTTPRRCRCGGRKLVDEGTCTSCGHPREGEEIVTGSRQRGALGIAVLQLDHGRRSRRRAGAP